MSTHSNVSKTLNGQVVGVATIDNKILCLQKYILMTYIHLKIVHPTTCRIWGFFCKLFHVLFGEEQTNWAVSGGSAFVIYCTVQVIIEAL